MMMLSYLALSVLNALLVLITVSPFIKMTWELSYAYDDKWLITCMILCIGGLLSLCFLAPLAVFGTLACLYLVNFIVQKIH